LIALVVLHKLSVVGEQQVLLLRYYKGLTQMNTARVLGVSQVQVSRLERRALEKLREEMM